MRDTVLQFFPSPTFWRPSALVVCGVARASSKKPKEKNAGPPRMAGEVTSLSGYFDVLGGLLASHEEAQFWYRGHADEKWLLCPSALRFPEEEQRERALELLDEFRRYAPAYFDVSSLPRSEDHLGWLGLAQHYGLPTRLLDWSTNPLVGLFFAVTGDDKTHGRVYLINPETLNVENCSVRRVLNGISDRVRLEPYTKMGARPVSPRSTSAQNTVALKPLHNSPRIHAQAGVFTLHGNVSFALDGPEKPPSSLVALRVPKGAKMEVRRQLELVGISPHTLFPEPPELCKQLVRAAGLKKD